MQVRTHRELASPAQQILQTAEPSFPVSAITTRATVDFTTRWLDSPKSVDLAFNELVLPHEAHLAERTMAYSDESPLSTLFIVSEKSSATRHKFIGAFSAGSIFFAGALSLLIFGGVLKLTRRCGWPSIRRSQPSKGTEIGLSELLRALRQADEAFKSQESSPPSTSQGKWLLANQRTSKRIRT
jgi:hypothetical protein